MNNEFPSIYLVAPLIGWFAAHLVKFLLTLVASGGREKNLGIFFRAGGMPSSHSAVMLAILTVIAARQGVGSAVFALGVTITGVILYDAVNVRRSVGEQGDALHKLADHNKVETQFFTAYGHSLTEVAVGGTIGILVGWLLLQIL